jgi:hypothetical protein
MDGIENEQPDNSLKQGFYSMLEDETQKMIEEEDKINIDFKNRVDLNTIIRYAAAIIIIFTIGYFVGNNAGNRNNYDAEIASLKEEIKMMQQNANLMSLDKPTASERLKAINTASDSNNSDEALLGALINTLNTDENVNVRMAAAFALAKIPDNEYVKTSLIRSLELQTEPIIQISLIGILTNLKDSRAKPVIEKLIEKEEVLPEVKQQALAGLKVFV